MPVVGAVAAAVVVGRGLATVGFAAARAVVAGAGAARLPTARLRAAAIGPRSNRLTAVARAAAILESPAAVLRFNRFQVLVNRDQENLAPKNPDQESLDLKSPPPENLGQKNPGPASPVPASRALENPVPENPAMAIGPVAGIGPVMAIDPAGRIDREIVLRFNRSHPAIDRAIGPITVIDRPATRTDLEHARHIGTDIGRPCIAAGTTATGTGIGITAALIGTPIRGAPGALPRAPSV